jgi:HEPN domain-containing protein
MWPAMPNHFSMFNHEFPPGCLVAPSPQRSGSRPAGARQRLFSPGLLLRIQGAEKALKGALLELGIEPPHTHVLNDLVRRLEEAGLDVSELSELPLRSLSRMAIQSRYPLDATPPSDLFDPGDADQALSCAHQVLRIVEALDRGQSSV